MLLRRKKGIIICLFAVVVGLIYSLPNILLTFTTPVDRVYLPFSFAETFYAAQAREISEGKLFVGDPQFIEHKNTFPTVFPYLPPVVLASLGWISGSVTNAFYVSDFLFPAILFVVISFVTFRLTRHFGYSICTSFVILFMYPISTKIPPVTREVWGALRDFIFLQNVSAPLPFYRTPNTQLTYIVLLIGLIFLYQLWTKPTLKTWIGTLTVGVLLFTTYFYHAVYFVFVVGYLFLLAFFKKNRQQAKSLFSILIGLGLTTIFYLYLGEMYPTLKITGGVFFSRYVDWISSLRYGGFWILLLILRKRLTEHFFVFVSALTGAAILCVNFQLITGWTVQPGHWPQTTLEPTIVLVAMISLYPLWKKWWKRGVVSIFLILLTTYGLLHQIRFVQTNPQVWSISKDLFNVYQWLNTHGKTVEVVTSLDLEVNSYIPVLTPVNLYTSVGQYHYGTLPELWERMLYNYKLYSLPDEPVEKSLLKTHASFEYTYNVNTYHHENVNEYSEVVQKQIQNCHPVTCANLFALPKSVILVMNQRYRELDLKNNPYRLDYAFYTPYEKSVGASIPPGKVVYQSGGYKLYQLKNSDENKF